MKSEWTCPNPQCRGVTRKTTGKVEFPVGLGVKITKVEKRPIGGTWVTGNLDGHEFNALVFSEHACERSWELHDSGISMLLVRRRSDNQVVFNWDRGIDIPAHDVLTQAIVDFIEFAAPVVAAMRNNKDGG